MTAVATAPAALRRRTETVQWLSPAPLWDSRTVGPAASGLTQPQILTQPWIAEFSTDSFIADFLALLAGQSTPLTPAHLAELAPEFTTDGNPGSPYRLFQPLSQRYYLVSATLAARRPGVPDHTLRADLGEQVHFVLRRLTADGEQAFVPDSSGGTWQPVTCGCYLAAEQQYPLHQAPVTPYAEPGATTAALGLDRCCGSGRTLWFGYVPVGVEKSLTRPMADPGSALVALTEDPAVGGLFDKQPFEKDPTLGWLNYRVVQPWRDLQTDQASLDHGYISLYLLLDLYDWLNTYLNPIIKLLGPDYDPAGTAKPLDGDPIGDLAAELWNAQVGQGNSRVTLAKALTDLAPYLPLVSGGTGAGAAPMNYDASTISYRADPHALLGDLGTAYGLLTLAEAALGVHAPVVPPELAGLIREDPPAAPAGVPTGTDQPLYVIRFVDTWDPCCCVVSAPSHPFQLAGALDADAPARKIVLRVPDITDLRSFKRGVAIETPPALQRVLDSITPDFLKNTGLTLGDETLGMICSYSLQIIFMVAFIVMFIFLIVLNTVFWWLPFLKICFPVPTAPKTSNGPLK